MNLVWINPNLPHPIKVQHHQQSIMLRSQLEVVVDDGDDGHNFNPDQDRDLFDFPSYPTLVQVRSEMGGNQVRLAVVGEEALTAR